MKDILLLHTIDGEYKTLEEYPKADENKIYYVTDENLQAQYISMFRQNGLTAAVLTHVIAPHFISMLEYKEQEKLKFLRIDSDLGSALKTEQTEEEKQQQERQQIAAVEIAEVQPREQAVEQIHLRCAPRRRWIPRRWRRRRRHIRPRRGRRWASVPSVAKKTSFAPEFSANCRMRCTQAWNPASFSAFSGTTIRWRLTVASGCAGL